MSVGAARRAPQASTPSPSPRLPPGAILVATRGFDLTGFDSERSTGQYDQRLVIGATRSESNARPLKTRVPDYSVRQIKNIGWLAKKRGVANRVLFFLPQRTYPTPNRNICSMPAPVDVSLQVGLFFTVATFLASRPLNISLQADPAEPDPALIPELPDPAAVAQIETQSIPVPVIPLNS